MSAGGELASIIGGVASHSARHPRWWFYAACLPAMLLAASLTYAAGINSIGCGLTLDSRRCEQTILLLATVGGVVQLILVAVLVAVAVVPRTAGHRRLLWPVPGISFWVLLMVWVVTTAMVSA